VSSARSLTLCVYGCVCVCASELRETWRNLVALLSPSALCIMQKAESLRERVYMLQLIGFRLQVDSMRVEIKARVENSRELQISC
jgi:hypothetical protein